MQYGVEFSHEPESLDVVLPNIGGNLAYRNGLNFMKRTSLITNCSA